MAKFKLLARQSAHPTGLLGEVVACAMSYDTARVNWLALDHLKIEADDDVIELGFGSGRALADMLGLYFLAPVVRKELDSYWARLESGEIAPFERNTMLGDRGGD